MTISSSVTKDGNGKRAETPEPAREEQKHANALTEHAGRALPREEEANAFDSPCGSDALGCHRDGIEAQDPGLQLHRDAGGAYCDDPAAQRRPLFADGEPVPFKACHVDHDRHPQLNFAHDSSRFARLTPQTARNRRAAIAMTGSGGNSRLEAARALSLVVRRTARDFVP
jgi:hypothetical protein